MPEHPPQDWTRVPRLERPRDDEAWTAPLARVQGAHVRLYADHAAFNADLAARDWML